jgi:hypothetical protein
LLITRGTLYEVVQFSPAKTEHCALLSGVIQRSGSISILRPQQPMLRFPLRSTTLAVVISLLLGQDTFLDEAHLSSI